MSALQLENSRLREEVDSLKRCLPPSPLTLLPLMPCCCLAAGAAVSALQLENSRLREEVDSLKRRLPALGLLRRTSSNVQLAGAATEQLVVELAQVCTNRSLWTHGPVLQADNVLAALNAGQLLCLVPAPCCRPGLALPCEHHWSSTCI